MFQNIGKHVRLPPIDGALPAFNLAFKAQHAENETLKILPLSAPSVLLSVADTPHFTPCSSARQSQSRATRTRRMINSKM
jgi:hypothetical protein